MKIGSPLYGSFSHLSSNSGTPIIFPADFRHEVRYETQEEQEQRQWLLSHVPIGLGGSSLQTTRASRRGKAYRAEGLDYDEQESVAYEEAIEKRPLHETTEQEVAKWILTTVIAIFVTIVAFGVSKGVEWLTNLKFSIVNRYVEAGDFATAGRLFIALNTALILVPALLVTFVEPKAKGSGVPEVKSYLNGWHLHRAVSFRTMVCKATGIVCSVGGGLIVGKEGPMIHSGAIIGAFMSQIRPEKWEKWGLPYVNSINYFRNDRVKRNFVSIGCACGVAAAFASPIGGTLFALEEASSFWSTKLTWLTLFGTMIAVLVSDMFLTGGITIASAPVISFGSYEGPLKDPSYPKLLPYEVWQVPIFMLIGAMGGLAGAAFNALNKKITRKRQSYVTGYPMRQMLDALVVAAFTATVLWLFAYHSPCSDDSNHIKGEYNMPLQRFACPPGQVSEGATVFYNSLDHTVKHLLHNLHNFSIWTCLGLFVTMWTLANITYGINVPSGMFIPAIITGGAMGRFVGEALHNSGYSAFVGSWDIHAGVFALMGSAAMLGGITRMTVSIVVIIIECTDNITYSIPIMLTIMTAKLVGDTFNKGLYDLHLELQGIPYLEEDEDLDFQSRTSRLKTTSVMSTHPVVFSELESIENILDVLNNCTHQGFPVVSFSEDSTTLTQSVSVHKHDKRSRDRRIMLYRGFILRSQLSLIIKYYIDTGTVTPDYQWFVHHYPKCPRTAKLHQQLLKSNMPGWRNQPVDLRPYYHIGAHRVHFSSRIGRVYRLFRNLGLRHITVVNSLNLVLGIISREDLDVHRLKSCSRDQGDEFAEQLQAEEDMLFAKMYGPRIGIGVPYARSFAITPSQLHWVPLYDEEMGTPQTRGLYTPAGFPE